MPTAAKTFTVTADYTTLEQALDHAADRLAGVDAWAVDRAKGALTELHLLQDGVLSFNQVVVTCQAVREMWENEGR